MGVLKGNTALYKKTPKRGKGKEVFMNFGAIHTVQSLPDQSAKFGSDWFRNVNLYKVQRNTHTNKENSALYIR
jgi:hypothetical protein